MKPELAAVVGAERFLAEITTTANLTHPHILPLHDSGEADSFVFYVMPYVEGESLRDKLDREHQLPVDDAVAGSRWNVLTIGLAGTTVVFGVVATWALMGPSPSTPVAFMPSHHAFTNTGPSRR